MATPAVMPFQLSRGNTLFQRRVLICGDRRWTNYQRILACVQKAHKTQPIDVIIEGECRGADLMGRRAGEAFGITILPYPALWDKYGKAAGPIRNQQMLDEGNPTECWAFHNDIRNSTGTADMYARASKAGLKIYVITETSWCSVDYSRPLAGTPLYSNIAGTR